MAVNDPEQLHEYLPEVFLPGVPPAVWEDKWVFGFADAFGSGGRAKLFALAEEMIGLPRALSLSQNYPDPFNSATTIEYALRSASRVVLEVYDLTGQRVRRLVDHYHEGGRYQTAWDGLDEAGKPLSSGVYLLRLQALGRGETRKMMLMK